MEPQEIYSNSSQQSSTSLTQRGTHSRSPETAACAAAGMVWNDISRLCDRSQHALKKAGRHFCTNRSRRLWERLTEGWTCLVVAHSGPHFHYLCMDFSFPPCENQPCFSLPRPNPCRQRGKRQDNKHTFTCVCEGFFFGWTIKVIYMNVDVQSRNERVGFHALIQERLSFVGI